MMEDISKETFVVENEDGSIYLDPWAGMTREQLKTRCGELCRALDDWQWAAMFAATEGGNDLENVREPYREQIRELIEAHKDDDE